MFQQQNANARIRASQWSSLVKELRYESESEYAWRIPSTDSRRLRASSHAVNLVRMTNSYLKFQEATDLFICGKTMKEKQRGY